MQKEKNLSDNIISILRIQLYEKYGLELPTKEINGLVCQVDSSLETVFSIEMIEAFKFAYNKKITTQCPITEANMTGKLIRKHLAKMISEYAVEILGKKTDYTRVCEFSDMYGQSSEMQKYAIEACALGLMGLDKNGNPAKIFNPNQKVDRAIFGTAFSRLLYGDVNNGQPGKRYDAHLVALKKNKIMTRIETPRVLEKRGYVMIMMMRAAELSINDNHSSAQDEVISKTEDLKEKVDKLVILAIKGKDLSPAVVEILRKNLYEKYGIK